MTIKHYSKTFTCDNIDAFDESMGMFEKLSCTIEFDYKIGADCDDYGVMIETSNHKASVEGKDFATAAAAFSYITGRADEYSAAERIVQDEVLGWNRRA